MNKPSRYLKESLAKLLGGKINDLSCTPVMDTTAAGGVPEERMTPGEAGAVLQ